MPIDFSKGLIKKTEPVIEHSENTTYRQELKKAIGLLECTLRHEPLDRDLRYHVKAFVKEMKEKGIKGAF